VLCDQARILDLAARRAEYIEQLPTDILFEVIDIIYGMNLRDDRATLDLIAKPLLKKEVHLLSRFSEDHRIGCLVDDN
jgi:hypothetical protein